MSENGDSEERVGSHDPVARRMQEAAGRVVSVAELPPAARIKARGAQRRQRKTTLSVLAAATAVIAVAGASLLISGNDARVSPATPSIQASPGSSTQSMVSSFTSPSASPTESASPTTTSPAGDSHLFDGSHAVDLRTLDGGWLAPNVEGGASVVAQPDPGGVPTSWVITPAGEGLVRLITVATTDGRPSCLHALADGVVGLDFCTDSLQTQIFTLNKPAQSDGQVSFASGGVYVAIIDGGLTTTADPARATIFTAADRGPVSASTR
jgi:hypothetical protein